VLRQPALLVLDEATSALDPESEARILAALEQLQGRMTILLITHRLGAVRDADLIHVIEDGRVVESGDWNHLFADSDGRLRELWATQDREPAAPAD
jgi:ATP-binding cassette, subfamily C, bacterial